MSLEKITILVVDDSDIIRHSLNKFFSGYDFRVISCFDGLMGIQQAQKYNPDLIILDLMMPDFNGMEMLQVIKTIDILKKIPVIIISANTSKSNVMAALGAGADKVISKPLRKEILIKNIKELLGEDFLKKSSCINTLEQEDKEFLDELWTIFLEQYPSRKQKITTALETKDKTVLSSIAHEMKGVGGSIGYNSITEICTDIEAALKMTIIEWQNVKIKWGQFFSIVEEIEALKAA